MGKKITPEEKAKIELRRTQVAANLLGGLTYRQMAQALGCSVGTIAGDVKAMMRNWRKEQISAAEQIIGLQMLRANRMINAIWDKAVSGDLNAQDRVRMWMDKIDRYMGVADVIKVGGPDGQPLLSGSPVLIVLPDNGRDGAKTIPASEVGVTISEYPEELFDSESANPTNETAPAKTT